MSALINTALQLADTGLPVFPCAANKQPALPKMEGGRGFHDASTDFAEVRSMFSHRSAVLIGVPTGELSSFDVLDLDYRHGAGTWEQANAHRIPETRIHGSRSGGRHLLFHHAPGVRNSIGNKNGKGGIAPGVDVRGEGGYIVWWPAHGVPMISDAEIAHWPDWLLSLALPRQQLQRSQHSEPPREPASQAAIEQKIRQALDGVRSAADGQKHFRLRNAALLLGGIADQAQFNNAEAIRWLLNALPTSIKDRKNAERTAAWGLENGRARPLDIRETEKRAPDPRRRELARSSFRLLRAGLASTDLLTRLHTQNRQFPDPLPSEVVNATVLWVAQQMKARHAQG